MEVAASFTLIENSTNLHIKVRISTRVNRSSWIALLTFRYKCLLKLLIKQLANLANVRNWTDNALTLHI